MPGKTVLIRADASAEIGIGHVMRCLALAQAWQKTGGSTIFAMAAGSEELASRIRFEGAEVTRIQAEPGTREDSARTAQLLSNCKAEWLVLDGYHFSADYLQATENVGPRCLWMADGEARLIPKCDIVLNPDPDVADTHPKDEGQACFLFGPKYALLRREFLEYPTRRFEVRDKAQRVLVTIGGGDFHNVTLQVLEALGDIHDVDLAIKVVVGPSNPHRALLQRALESYPHTVELVSNVQKMPEVMSQSDLAITAGGGTCYELAFLKVPMFLITMAKNHERAVQAYGEAEAAFAAGWFSSLERSRLAGLLRDVICNRELRSRLVENAARMVDGNGAARVVEVMQSMTTTA